MPHVIPFRGLLYADPDPDAMSRVLAPPFDMISEAEQAALFATDARNIAHVTLPPKDTDPDYTAAGARFQAWREDGTVRADAEQAFYVYEQTRNVDGAQVKLLGFIGAVALDNDEATDVYGHENIFPEPVADRVKLTRQTKCRLEPVLATYVDASARIEGILEAVTTGEPIFSTTLVTGASHRLWRMTDPDQQAAVQEILAAGPAVIADGHHRSAGAKAYREAMRAEGRVTADSPCNYTMMLLAEAQTSGLLCGPFHRIVHRLPDAIDPAQLESLLGPAVSLAPVPTEGLSDAEIAAGIVETIARQGKDAPTLGCRWAGGAAIVTITDLDGLLASAGVEMTETTKAFDVALLHRLILKPRLGCTGEFGPRACGVTFEQDPVRAWQAVDAGAAMTWFVNPARTEDVTAAALASEKVPQKGTHFFPKPPSGMVMYDLSE